MIKIVKSGGEGHGMNYREFIITAAADVANLPNSQTPAPNTADIGSVAYTQDMSKMYMLGPDDVWREV
jgi:hypothetical protein